MNAAGDGSPDVVAEVGSPDVVAEGGGPLPVADGGGGVVVPDGGSPDVAADAQSPVGVPDGGDSEACVPDCFEPQYFACGHTDSCGNSCGTVCLNGGECAGGTCVCPQGPPVCTPGATQCSGGGVQTCTGCGQWTDSGKCPPFQTCSGGTCVTLPTDCPGPYVLCDGFESGAINASVWQSTTDDANQTIAVDGTNPHRGKDSLHIHVNGLPYGAMVRSHLENISLFTPTPPTELWVRAWFYISALPGTDDNALVQLLSSANGGSETAVVGFDNAGLFDALQNTPGGAGDYHHVSAFRLRPGAWTCLALVEPGISGGLEVYEGQTSSSDSALNGSVTGLQPLSGVDIGIDFQLPAAFTSTPFDLYVDDVAIDTADPGCD